MAANTNDLVKKLDNATKHLGMIKSNMNAFKAYLDEDLNEEEIPALIRSFIDDILDSTLSITNSYKEYSGPDEENNHER